MLLLGQAEGIRTFGGLFVVGLVWAFVGDLVILPAVVHAAESVASARFPVTSPTLDPGHHPFVYPSTRS